MPDFIWPDNLAVPNGCRWCGHDRHGHFSGWHRGGEWHTWAEPTDEQRLTRMRARREARRA